MRSYICGVILSHFRQIFYFRDRQKRGRWDQCFLKPMTRPHVGIMGLGVIGKVVADALLHLNFQLSAWVNHSR